MYASISGLVEQIHSNGVTVSCAGVGYEIMTNTYALQNAKLGENAKFYTHLVVREDSLTLYGFLSMEEKAMFQRLITVSGVGPKLALAVLSGLSARKAALAIVTGDEKALSSISGVGKKTAQRIILELKGAISNEQLVETGSSPLLEEKSDAAAEAAAALVAMGFSPMDSAAAVALVKAEGGTAEQMAMNALRRLDRQK